MSGGGEDDWLPATQQMMPATQVLNFSDDEDDDPLLIGLLEICGKQHKIFSGQCRIGRDKTCEIVLSQPSLSRVHAIIEGDNDGVTIHDAGSSNGTRKENIKLRKNIRYNLTDGETIKFGDVDAKFKIVNSDEMDETASVASNASESLMALDEDHESTLDNQAGGQASVIETKTAGESSPENDENRPPNFVPETPANFGLRGRRLLGSDEYFVPGSQSSPLPTEGNNLSRLKQDAVFKVPDSPNTSNLNDSSFLMSSQPVINTETSRPARPTITKTRIDLNNDSDATIALAEADESSDVQEDSLVASKSVSRAEESQSLIDDSMDKSNNSSQNIRNISDTELMIKETQAVKTSMSDSQLFNAETQQVSKMSDSLLMMQPTQAPLAKLSESELMMQPTQAPCAKLSESELMMQPTQAPFSRLSESELMMVETQALSTSKLSETQLMGFPTQAFNLSESQMLAVETQAINKLSESDLMLASTQAICKLSESEMMSAETQNLSNMSDSRLMSAATQVISPFVKPKQKLVKSTESELMIDPTQNITAHPNVVENIEVKSESESMTTETQAYSDDKEANEHDFAEEKETQKVDQEVFSNQDVEKEEGNEETRPFDLSNGTSNDSLNLMDGEDNEEEHDEKEPQEAPVDVNSEDLLNADTQSIPSVKNDSEEIMLLKTQSIERESDEILPSSNDKVECSQSLFDAETDEFMAGIDSKSNTPVEAEVLDSKDQEGVEDKDDTESEDDMFIESSQGPIQNNRSRLRELSAFSQSSVVQSSQLQDDLNVKSKNPVQDDSESNISEAGSENLMDDLEDGDVTDDDLQALFNKNRRLDSEKLSQSLSIPGSQPRPSSEVIPPSQEAEPLPKVVKSKLTLTTNYSVKSMEETNLDYQSSQETDSKFKETLSGLIDNLEVSRNDIEETMIAGNNETVTNDDDIHKKTLDEVKSDESVVVKTPIKVSNLITKEEEEVSSPIIAKNQSSQSIKALDTSNDSRKKTSSLANMLGNDDSESEDEEPLPILPDIDQDFPIAATDELEIGSDIKEIKDAKEDGIDQTKENETPQRKPLKLAEIVLKTPTQVRLCREVKESSPIRPESGPFLPDTLEMLSNEKDGTKSGEAKSATAKDSVKKNISIITPEEEEIPEESLGRGRRVRKSNAKYEEENVSASRKSLPENPPVAKPKRGRKSAPAASVLKNQLAEQHTDSSLPEQNYTEQKGVKGKKSRRSLNIKMTSVSESNQECSFVDETKIIIEETNEEGGVTTEAPVSQDSEILFPGDKGDPEMASALTQIDIKVTSKPTSPVLSNPEEIIKKDLINLDNMTESQILDDTPLTIRAKRKVERLSKQSLSSEIKSSGSRENSVSINEGVETKKPDYKKSRASKSVDEKSVCIDDAEVNKRVSLRGVKVDILKCNVEQEEQDLRNASTDKDDLDKHEELTKDDVEISKVRVSRRGMGKDDEQEDETVESTAELTNKGEIVNLRGKSGGRRGKSKDSNQSKDETTEENIEDSKAEIESVGKTKPVKKVRGKANNAPKQATTTKGNNNEELSKEKKIDNVENNQPLAGRRGRGKSNEQVEQDQSNEVNENQVENVDTKPTRGRRGRSNELKEKDNVDKDTTIQQKAEPKRRGRPKANIKQEKDDLPAANVKQETQVRKGRASKAQLLENISTAEGKVETLIGDGISINESIKEEVKGKRNRRFTLATTSIKEEIKVEEDVDKEEIEASKPAKRSTRGRPSAVKSEPKSRPSQIKKEGIKKETDINEEIDIKEKSDSKEVVTNSIKRKRGIKEEFIVKDEGSVSRRKRTTKDAGMSNDNGSPQKRHKSESKRDESTESVRSTRSSRSSGKSSTVKQEEVKPKSSDLKRKLGPSVSASNKLTNGKVKKGSRSGSDSSTCGSQHDVTGSPSLRRAANKAYKVMFTGYENENEYKIVKDLGGEVIEENEVHECNVLVTDKVRRTVKFLCMLGRGTPIVSPAWIKESKIQGSFVNPNSYIIEDREMERKFSMDLDSTFELVTMRGPLLKGLSFYVTKKVKPTPDQFKEIIECAGGTVLTSPPTSPDPKTYVISCIEDKTAVDKLKRSGVRVMDKEFLLTGLFRYSLDTKLAL